METSEDSGSTDLFVGLFEVRPKPGESPPEWWSRPPKMLGGFVNVLAVAKNVSAFRRRVDAALDEMNLKVISVENAERFDRRVLTSRLDPDFVQLAREARESGEVCFDTFDMYPEEE